jgi:hypothetical protein
MQSNNFLRQIACLGAVILLLAGCNFSFNLNNRSNPAEIPSSTPTFSPTASSTPMARPSVTASPTLTPFETQTPVFVYDSTDHSPNGIKEVLIRKITSTGVSSPSGESVGSIFRNEYQIVNGKYCTGLNCFVFTDTGILMPSPSDREMDKLREEGLSQGFSFVILQSINTPNIPFFYSALLQNYGGFGGALEGYGIKVVFLEVPRYSGYPYTEVEVDISVVISSFLPPQGQYMIIAGGKKFSSIADAKKEFPFSVVTITVADAQTISARMK